MAENISDAEDFQGSFDDREPPARRRGRQTLISDAELLVRRENFVKAFESRWGEIGWELKKCKKVDDILRVLRSLEDIEFIRRPISMFLRESEGRVSASLVRKLRTELQRKRKLCLAAELLKQRAMEQLQQVNSLLIQARPSEWRLIKRAQKKRGNEASRTFSEWRQLRERQTALEAQLVDLEARFAQQEILRFRKSERYDLTPLHLANAVCGLPFMGWRRSMQRSGKVPSAAANGIDYQVFIAIRLIARDSKKSSEQMLVEEFRKRILNLSSAHREAGRELRKQWYFVQPAIRRAFRAKVHPNALPFEIAKHYFRQLRACTPIKRVLAQQSELRNFKASLIQPTQTTR